MRKISDEELYKVVAHLNSPTIRELQTHWKNEFGRGIISSRAAEFKRKYFSDSSKILPQSDNSDNSDNSDSSQRVFDLSKFDEQQISVFEKEIEENNRKISLLQNRNKEIRFELSILKMKYSYEKRIYELEEENRALKDKMINRELGSDKEEGELIISDNSLPLFLDESVDALLEQSKYSEQSRTESELETSVLETGVETDLEVESESEASVIEVGTKTESVLEISVLEAESEVEAEAESEVEAEAESEVEAESVLEAESRSEELVVPGTAKEFRKFLKDFKELEVKYLKTYDSIEKMRNEIDSSFVGWYIRFSENELFKFVGRDVSTAFEYLESNYLKK